MRAPRLLCGVLVAAALLACVGALAVGHAFGTQLSQTLLVWLSEPRVSIR